MRPILDYRSFLCSNMRQSEGFQIDNVQRNLQDDFWFFFTAKLHGMLQKITLRFLMAAPSSKLPLLFYKTIGKNVRVAAPKVKNSLPCL